MTPLNGAPTLNAVKVLDKMSLGQSAPMLLAGMNVTLERENSHSRALEDGGKPVGIVLHWTAGSYSACFDGYHFNVVYDPKVDRAYVVKTLEFDQKGQHIWGRNTGLIGISVCAMRQGTLKPAKAQLEVMAVLAAEICAWKHIDPAGTLTLPKMASNDTSIWRVDGTITVPMVNDHGHYAKLDGYASARWDIGSYYESVHARVVEVYRELKSGKRQFQYKALLVD